MCPLPALGFMAGHGIGELDLKSIVVTIALQFFDALCLLRDVRIILHHRIKQLFLLLVCQGRSLGGQRVQTDGSRQLVVVIVGQCHRHLRKAEAIEFVNIPDTLHHSSVAIGEEGNFLRPLRPEIVILHNHQQVTAAELLVTVEHHIADALVIDVRPFVTTRDDDGLVHPRMVVT